MKYNNIRSFNTLLQNSPTISKLYYKLQQLQQLNNIITSFLPTIIAQHCSVSNLTAGTLILTTTSPVWNHQINFLKMDLLNKLRNSDPIWAGITGITVKTNYLMEELNNYKQINNNNKTKPKKITLSAHNIAIINNIANNEISYSPLAKMLKKLCDNAEHNTITDNLS